MAFHDNSLYSVSAGDKPQPGPAPSIFQENALLQEILSSVAEMGRREEPTSPVSDIIDDVIENIVLHASQAEDQTEEDGGATRMLRNESYHRAIENDEQRSLTPPVL